VGCYINWYSEEGPGRAEPSPSPLLAVPNVTARPSTASVPFTVLLYDGQLLCGFNVAIKGLNSVMQQPLAVLPMTVASIVMLQWLLTNQPQTNLSRNLLGHNPLRGVSRGQEPASWVG